MDPKAAAKSKRLQSQQGRRNHPTPSAAVAHKKKESLPQPKQPQQRGEPSSRRHRRHDLPSNWDRYDEDDAVVEAEGGGPARVRGDAREPAARATAPLAGGGDALAPKSKGADFAYLIEQARSRPRDRDYGDGGLASACLSDETMPGFAQGLLSLISVKGESLLSWCSNDNFTVDNDTGSSFEVPFLSMDVNALVEQLSKLNMAKRLFIEEDILPPEQHDYVETQYSNEDKHSLVEDAFPGAENGQLADGQYESSQSKAVEGHDYMQRPGKEVSPSFLQGRHIRQDPTNSFESLEWESKRHSEESGAISDMSSIQDSASRFEPATAEAELDRLLHSFGVTDDVASSAFDSNKFATNHAFSDRLVHMGAAPSRQESGSLSKAGTGVSLEDTVDEVLAEAKDSNSSNTQLKPLSMDIGTECSRPSFSDFEKSIDDLLAETSFFYSPGTDGPSDGTLGQGRSRVSSAHVGAQDQRDEHDSRHDARGYTMSLEETIEDLLAAASAGQKSQENLPQPRGKLHISTDKSTSVSKVLDDVNVWLDSI